MERKLGTIDQPKMFPIKRILEEAKDIKTFFFDTQLNSRPGQFVIMWIPRVDEKPFSIAYDEGGQLGLTIAKVGRFTEKLYTFTEGDLLGIRGPYGAPFTLKEGYKKILLVGGGYGVAPLATLASQALDKNIEIDFCNGARTKDLLLFQDRLKKLDIPVHVSTDDGSEGHKGFVTDIVADLFKKGQYDCVYTCGPELMEKKVVDLAVEENIPSQVSIERYMKCGFGICGACCVDDSGKRMCVEGPVTSGEFALKQKEFGAYHRHASGKKESFS
ncbi:dihydroorotate dehydrogenase electron transfer subunit [Patescibacteria group bacterium]